MLEWLPAHMISLWIQEDAEKPYIICYHPPMLPRHWHKTVNDLQVDIDFEKEPIGVGKDGKNVYFRDIWPSTEEIAEVSS